MYIRTCDELIKKYRLFGEVRLDRTNFCNERIKVLEWQIRREYERRKKELCNRSV